MTKWLDHIEEVIVAVVLAVMSIIAFTNVLTRNFLDLSLAFTEEVTVNLFVFLTFVGASIGVRKHAHLGFSLLFDISPKSIKKSIIVFLAVIAIVFFVTVGYYGYDTALYQMDINNKTPALGWPQWIYTMALPIGAGLCLLRTIQVSIKQWKELVNGEQEVDE
ncbi:TRAP transporter small permease [Tenuibacillus multivorans]|uniref:TRAP-type C4-dicarboxylate transport system, small permease component n=1 Tax=Tenuibacillus multivorans TaxID=237069 RepID=A0A1H0BZE2_9BACI|nr:TRAP transporter small permease [Tenuibacillus multivorans]GEL78579.1 C4-dicarboxylate ABC transporter permease [Tenuibacillus multivorans]SDN50926.1 TRAP-type C4-dicarboxylate transport system, small permease component [Tenuibacillus multivorans]